MKKINKDFTYDLADDYLAQTNDLGKTASWTYTGPDKIWIYVVNDTGKLFDGNIYTEDDDGEFRPEFEGCTKVLINAKEHLLLCTLLGASEYNPDPNDLPQFTETLPDGMIYSRPCDPMPDHTYDYNSIVYDFENKSWSFEWFKSWTTWEEIVSHKDKKLQEVIMQIENIKDLPDSLKLSLEGYKSELENFETTWEKYKNNVNMINLPQNPLG